MKIVHLLSQNHLTGAEVYASTLATQQLASGHQVYQISNGFFAPTPAIRHPLEVETRSKITMFKNILWLRQFIKTEGIQMLHTHSRAAAKLAYWARLGLDVAMVSTIHGKQHPSPSKKLFNQYGDLMIAICENIQDHLVKDFGYSRRRMQVVRNPIDTQKFSFIASEQKTKYQKVAIVGRATGPKKDRTEQVIKKILEIQPDTEITLVGGNKSDLELSTEVKNKLTEVHLPHLSSSDYAGFDLIVGAGRVCMEALMSGVTTIAFGEAEYIGLIHLDNFSRALESNFGDINLNSSGPCLNMAQFRKDLRSFLAPAELQALSQKAIHDFSFTAVATKMMRLYESAYFLRHYSQWIPVLMYHKIPTTEIKSQHRIFVLKENFEKHLKFFKARGFQTLTFSDLQKFRQGEKDFSLFPKKPLILTFDDGYRDNLENASPLLEKYGYRAQLFLLANAEIKSNQWDVNSTEPAHEIVSGEERKLWLRSAFEIGSHGFSHQKITEMSEEESLRELSLSKESLEKELGIKINTYAFTYGSTNQRAAELAVEAGYDYAVNTDTGGLLIEEAPYQIFRVNIFPEDDAVTLWKKTSSWYRNYYLRKRKK